jgi:hypothetical protein
MACLLQEEEAERFAAFTPKAVNYYFDRLEDFDWVEPDLIVNMDEGGVMEANSIYASFNLNQR